MMGTVLVAKSLGKAYPLKPKPSTHFRTQLLGRPLTQNASFWAVRDVSFSLQRGESVGIIGSNGSGKSTLLQLICGIMSPSEGTVSCHGRISSLLELGAGFNPDFSGRDNVFMNAALLGLSRQQIEARFDEIAAFAEIGRFLDEPVKTYSSGMYVRLAFAVASHIDPDIMVVDEALSVGDARFSAKCIKRIRALRDRGTTLLFVSHDVGIVRTLCDRALWLKEGVMVALGDVFGVTSRYMEYMFEGESDAIPVKTGMPSSPDDSEIDTLCENIPMQPLNHWGSQVGAIQAWHFFVADRRNAYVVEYGETIRLEVIFERPQQLDPVHLAMSISIKDLKGSDLVVLSSQDENSGVFSGMGNRVRVVFEFVNRLTEGKYLLVIALEDRTSEAIQYFEYIEGAHYFSVSSRARRFGIFNVPVSISVSNE